MTSAWLLPEHIADVLPAEARRIEELRRVLLDAARGYGYELVAPPLMEYIESLLSGTGRELDLRTFKLVDQLSGRTMGLRADTTPQVARIDAHLLNRAGVTRLCYCGPVAHTRPDQLHATREPLQLGAELFGHAGMEADLEIQELALEGLSAVGLSELTLDLADARIVHGLLPAASLSAGLKADICLALSHKDAPSVSALSASLGGVTQNALLALMDLYGDVNVLDRARKVLPQAPAIQGALKDLAWLAIHLQDAHAQVRIGFDLADLSGYAYYTGTRFAIYTAGAHDALVRGGRYDEVGAVFGRKRPAVGFSLDLKNLVQEVKPLPMRLAVRAPWSEDAQLRSMIRALRQQGETVVCVLPGHEHEVQEFACDRELVLQSGQWVVHPLAARTA